MRKMKILKLNFWKNKALDFLQLFKKKTDFVSIRVKTAEGFIEVGGTRAMVCRTWLDFCRHGDEFLKQPDQTEFVENLIASLHRAGVEQGFIKEFEELLEWDELLEVKGDGES